jgi:hypothetical protein
MKVTRSLTLAFQILTEMGEQPTLGQARKLQAKIAGLLLMNPSMEDQDVAFQIASNWNF